jgi:triacylglycerol lipase
MRAIWAVSYLAIVGCSAAKEVEPVDRAAAPLPTEAPSAPAVVTSPSRFTLPCGNRSLPYGFRPEGRALSASDAFWTMWLTLRAFDAKDAATEAELRSVGFDQFQAFEDRNAGLLAYVASNGSLAVLAFRGSTEPKNWLADFNFPQKDGPSSFGVAGRVHQGFLGTLAPSFPAIEEALYRMTKREIPVWVTGHSLGGAIATLAATRLAHDGFRLGPLYTFAGPRAGDTVFAEDTRARLGGAVYRFVHGLDIVPRVPPTAPAASVAGPLIPTKGGRWAAETLVRLMDYGHAGDLYTFDGTGAAPTPPATDEADDLAYWARLAAIQQRSGILGVLLANAEQGKRHDPGSYICDLRAWYEATE